MCRAWHGLVTLVGRLVVHAEQVAVAELAQYERFAVLLQLDGAFVQAGLRAIAEVETVELATVGLVAATRHMLERHQVQVGAEFAQRCGTFAGTDASSIADHLQGLHRQRRLQRVQLLRGYFDAEAATTVLQAQLLQAIACSGRKRRIQRVFVLLCQPLVHPPHGGGQCIVGHGFAGLPIVPGGVFAARRRALEDRRAGVTGWICCAAITHQPQQR